jgi:hypothetical protein
MIQSCSYGLVENVVQLQLFFGHEGTLRYGTNSNRIINSRGIDKQRESLSKINKKSNTESAVQSRRLVCEYLELLYSTSCVSMCLVFHGMFESVHRVLFVLQIQGQRLRVVRIKCAFMPTMSTCCSRPPYLRTIVPYNCSVQLFRTTLQLGHLDTWIPLGRKCKPNSLAILLAQRTNHRLLITYPPTWYAQRNSAHLFTLPTTTVLAFVLRIAALAEMPLFSTSESPV